jgi:Leucine-rich repeat (LRR) protein
LSRLHQQIGFWIVAFTSIASLIGGAAYSLVISHPIVRDHRTTLTLSKLGLSLDVKVSNLPLHLRAAARIGIIPSELKYVRAVTFAGIAITPAIARLLNRCSRLEELCVEHPSFSDVQLARVNGSLPIVKLSLDNTNLTDACITSLNRFDGLQELTLSNTRITDNGMTQLRPNSHLVMLNLANTAVSDRTVDHLTTAFPNLAHLFLSQIQISDPSLSAFGRLSYLVHLSIPTTQITDSGQLNSSTLAFLDVGNTKIGNQFAKRLQNSPNLATLNLRCTKISDEGILYFLKNVDLEKLNLGRTSITDRSIIHLTTVFPNLIELKLDTTGISNDCVGDLQRLKSIQILNLSNTAITDTAPLVRGSLQTLYVANTKIGDNFAKRLQHLPHLSFVDISNTEIGNDGCATLARITHLNRIRARKIGSEKQRVIQQGNPNVELDSY